MGGNFYSDYEQNNFFDDDLSEVSASSWLINVLRTAVVKIAFGFVFVALILLLVEQIPNSQSATATAALESSIQAGTANGPITSLSNESSSTTDFSIVPQFSAGNTTTTIQQTSTSLEVTTSIAAQTTTAPSTTTPDTTEAPTTTNATYVNLDFFDRPGAAASPEGVKIDTTKITGDSDTVIIELGVTCNGQSGVLEVWIKTDTTWELLSSNACSDSIRVKQTQDISAGNDYLIDVRYENAEQPAGDYAEHLILSITAKTK